MQKLMLLFVTILAAGCAQSDPCGWAGPIYPTADDVQAVSASLARQLLNHNETGARVCGW
jgi:hypothetical protein